MERQLALASNSTFNRWYLGPKWFLVIQFNARSTRLNIFNKVHFQICQFKSEFSGSILSNETLIPDWLWIEKKTNPQTNGNPEIQWNITVQVGFNGQWTCGTSFNKVHFSDATTCECERRVCKWETETATGQCKCIPRNDSVVRDQLNERKWNSKEIVMTPLPISTDGGIHQGEEIFIQEKHLIIAVEFLNPLLSLFHHGIQNPIPDSLTENEPVQPFLTCLFQSRRSHQHSYLARRRKRRRKRRRRRGKIQSSQHNEVIGIDPLKSPVNTFMEMWSHGQPAPPPFPPRFTVRFSELWNPNPVDWDALTINYE